MRQLRTRMFVRMLVYKGLRNEEEQGEEDQGLELLVGEDLPRGEQGACALLT